MGAIIIIVFVITLLGALINGGNIGDAFLTTLAIIVWLLYFIFALIIIAIPLLIVFWTFSFIFG